MDLVRDITNKKYYSAFRNTTRLKLLVADLCDRAPFFFSEREAKRYVPLCGRLPPAPVSAKLTQLILGSEESSNSVSVADASHSLFFDLSLLKRVTLYHIADSWLSQGGCVLIAQRNRSPASQISDIVYLVCSIFYFCTAPPQWYTVRILAYLYEGV